MPLKLSVAMRRVRGREAEADLILEEAENLRLQIIDRTQKVAIKDIRGLVKEEDFDALIHISQR